MSPLPDDQRLTSLQLAVLRSLWERGEASVAEVHSDLCQKRDLAPTTVATLMKRLEARGLLDHRSEGRQFIYRALVDADDVGRTMATELVDDVYSGSVTGLFAHLLDEGGVSREELKEIKRMIARAEGGTDSTDP